MVMYDTISFKRCFLMRVTTTKSKNAESFYITRSYVKSKGVTTSREFNSLISKKSLQALKCLHFFVKYFVL